MPSMCDAHRDEQPAEILHVRLAGRVVDRRHALGQRGRHERVLGGRDRGLVEVELLALEAARRAEAIGAVGGHLGAQRLEREQVRSRRAGGRSRRRPAAARRRCRSARAAGRPAGSTRGCAPRAPRRATVELTSAAHTRTSLRCVHATSAPRSTSSSSMVSTSRMRGMLPSTTGSEVSSVAASSVSAAFLLPSGRIVPVRGTPPSMTRNSCVRGRVMTVRGVMREGRARGRVAAPRGTLQTHLPGAPRAGPASG